MGYFPRNVDRAAIGIGDGMQLRFMPPFVWPIRRSLWPPPLFRPQASRRAVRLEIGRVDHHRRRDSGLGGQPSHHPGEDRLFRSTASTGVEEFLRAILPWRIAPPQTIAVDKDYPAQNTPVIDARIAMALRKEGLKPRHLCVGQPEKVAHRSVSSQSLNHAYDAGSMGSETRRSP